MVDVRYRRLDPIALPLANKFYRQHRSSMRARGDETVWVAEHRELVGAVRLRPVEHGHWLTGLFVSPALRKQSVGSRLVEHAVCNAGEPVWLFCHPDLSPFYGRLGFRPCAALPESLASRLGRYRQTQSLEALEYVGHLSSAPHAQVPY